MSGAGRAVLTYIEWVERRTADAVDNARYYGYPPPQDGESVSAFVKRIAGSLRRDGRIIEAHEVYSGRRYDDPEGQGTLSHPVTGVIGALAGALAGHQEDRDGGRQLGDDLAKGVIAGSPDPNAPIRAMFDALGPGAAMDVLDSFRGR